MLLRYFFISLAIGFFGGFFSISSIIYCLLVMLRRGVFLAVITTVGILLAQLIWVAATVIVLLLFGRFYDPSRFDYWWDGLVVALILFYVAYRFLVVNPKNDLAQQSGSTPSKIQALKQMGAGFVFTITTPQWVVGYLLILSALHVDLRHKLWVSSALVGFGLLIGVTLFWLATLLILRLVHARASEDLVKKLNKIGASIMIVLGCVGLADTIKQLF